MYDMKLCECYRMTSSGTKLWYFASELSMLFEVDLNSCNTSLLLDLKEYDSSVYRTFSKINDVFYIFSAGGDKVCVFNKCTGEISFRPIDIDEDDSLNWASNCECFDDRCIFFWVSAVIVDYNAENGKFSLINSFKSSFSVDYNPNHWFGRIALREKENLYIILRESHKILMMNTTTNHIRVLEMNFKGNIESIVLMTLSEGKYWFLCQKEQGGVVIFFSEDIESGATKLFCELPAGEKKDFPFTVMGIGERYIWMLPGKNDKGYKIDKSSGEAFEIEDIPIVSNEKLSKVGIPSYNYHTSCKGDNGIIYSLHAYTGSLIKIDIEKDVVEKEELTFSDEIQGKLLRILRPEGQFRENIDIGLKDLINYVSCVC